MFPENLVQACFQQVRIMIFALKLFYSSSLLIKIFFFFYDLRDGISPSKMGNVLIPANGGISGDLSNPVFPAIAACLL